MTWAAARDPGLYSVRFWMDRFGWKAAHVRGRWELRDGNRVLARVDGMHALVKAVQRLATTAMQMERIEAEREAEAHPVSLPEPEPVESKEPLVPSRRTRAA